MGIMVLYSLLWVMQDSYHQQYVLVSRVSICRVQGLGLRVWGLLTVLEHQAIAGLAIIGISCKVNRAPALRVYGVGFRAPNSLVASSNVLVSAACRDLPADPEA